LHPQSESKILLKARKGSQKNIFEKVSEKFGGFENSSYLCTTFRSEKKELGK
jgi:hypothetical protein